MLHAYKPSKVGFGMQDYPSIQSEVDNAQLFLELSGVVQTTKLVYICL